MGSFTFKDIYIEAGKRVLEVDILPEKYCNFDCIFCPVGRSKNKVDTPREFDNIEKSLEELGEKINKTNAELVFINSKGEAFINDKIIAIIQFIQGKGIPVRLLTNGYLLGRKNYLEIANQCNEVIGELKVISEEDFQKIQRPMTGYTLTDYISNMIDFQKQYLGVFILEITIIKGYNDDKLSIQKLRKIIHDISPDKLIVVRIEDERFKNKLCITEERLLEITNELEI